jgi:hypothetical protein
MVGHMNTTEARHQPYFTSDPTAVHAGCACGWVADGPQANDPQGQQVAQQEFEAHLNVVQAGTEWNV